MVEESPVYRSPLGKFDPRKVRPRKVRPLATDVAKLSMGASTIPQISDGALLEHEPLTLSGTESFFESMKTRSPKGPKLDFPAQKNPYLYGKDYNHPLS